MTRERNMAAQEIFGEAANTGNFDLFRKVVAPNSVDHDPAPGQVAGPEGFRQVFAELHTAFPDIKISLEHLVADDDNLAFAYTMTGTHKGTFMGHAPTGKQVKIRGLQISKFADGMLVERWGSSDQLGILQQLGLAPSA